MVQVWHILTIAFLDSAVEAFDQPARRAFFLHLIERGAMMSAVAMNSSIWRCTRIIAPAAAGFFAMAYVPLMPMFDKDILDVGPGGMGTLLGISGVGSLLTTI